MADEKEKEEESAKTPENTEQKEGEAAAETGEESPPPKSKKLLIFIIIGVVVLIGAGAATYFLLFSSSSPQQEEERVVEYTPTYFPVPDIKLRMRYLDKSIGYMVVGLTLRIPKDSNPEDYKQREPEILDTLHTFIGSLNLDDFTPESFNRFSTPVGLERVRQNIVVRLNTVLSPLKVDTVLFRKLITQ